MSRPPISYPTPIPGPSRFSPEPQVRRPSLELRPFPSDPNVRRPDAQRRQSASSGRSTAGSLDSHITRLLVTTKQLLQGLDAWAQGGISEDALDPIPHELRLCLEPALSEEPSQETLNRYLPHIRSVIYNLLNGLKQKQATYKRLVTDRQPEPPAVPPPPQSRPSTRLDPNSDDRRSARSPASHGSGSPASATSQMPATKIPSSQALAERQRAEARPAPPDAFRPSRMRVQDANQPRRSGSSTPVPTEPPPMVRHQLADNPVPSPPPGSYSPSPAAPPPPKPTPPHPDRFSRDSFGNPRPVSHFSADSEFTNGSPVRSPPSQISLKDVGALPPKMTASVPPSLPTLNLPSAIRLSDTSLDPSPSDAQSFSEVPAETRATLAALQRSDALERRASKRFSSYTFNRMIPGSPNHKKASSTGSPQRPTRRSDRAPRMPPLPESMASSNLSIVSDGDWRDRSSSSLDSTYLQANGNDHSRSSNERSTSPPSSRLDVSAGSVRIVKTPDPEEITQQSTPRPGDLTDASTSPMPTSGSVSVFLQIGRQVKKASLELPISLSSLRLLFMERFEYDPGMEDFPDLYIRDNRTGVQFELEDMDDLREGCVLSLNFEPLDQVKQHFDLTFASMMQEIKEMKSSFERSKRISMPSAPSLLSPAMSPNIRPSGRALESIPRAPSPSPRPSGPLNTVREAELQAQYEEVQSLRRDLAVVRQIHVDFLAETKDSFAKLRTQNSTMREVVKTKMGGSRALLDNSKTKLEAQCTTTIQAVEEISDVIDAAREDAFKRFVSPSKNHMASIQANLRKATEMVDQFTTEVTAVEPTWRATWHLELGRVMEEQRLLPYQTKLCTDLKNDIKDATDMLQNVQDFVNQRQAGLGRSGSKGFRPPSPDENGGIPNLLVEIRTKESDPNSRLKAIEAQRKAREREKANETDEFSSELTGFVTGKKLKKTGGTDEVERTRQRRQDQTIKRMLTGDGGSPPSGMLSPQSTGTVLTPASTGSGRSSRTATGSSGKVKEEM